MEQAVYKKDKKTGGTLFDHMEKTILDMQIELKGTIREFVNKIDNLRSDQDEKMFKMNTRVTKMEGY